MRHLGVLIGILITFSALEAAPVVIKTEGKEFHTGLLHEPGDESLKKFGVTHVTIADCENLPEEFDLKDVGVSLPIRSQGSCGSCWAFSKTASMESAVLANTGKLIDFSEQELVSCDKNNAGCGGGNLNRNEYQVTHGQGLESDFPYQARNVRCQSIQVQTKATDFVRVGESGRRPTPKEVQCAIFQSHTIPWITVSANGRWGSFPHDPDAVVTRCGSGSTNHAIGVTGWKTVNGKVYFRIRNSWGESFGYKGTALMTLGCDSLGQEVAYIMTDVMPCKPPKVKLPVTVTINAGDEVELAVKGEQGVTYIWTADGVTLPGTGPEITIAPSKDSIYKVVAKNSCGTAESSVQVKVTN